MADLDRACLRDCPQERRLPRSVLADEEGNGGQEFQRSGLLEDRKAERVAVPYGEGVVEEADRPHVHASWILSLCGIKIFHWSRSGLNGNGRIGLTDIMAQFNDVQLVFFMVRHRCIA